MFLSKHAVNAAKNASPAPIVSIGFDRGGKAVIDVSLFIKFTDLLPLVIKMVCIL